MHHFEQFVQQALSGAPVFQPTFCGESGYGFIADVFAGHYGQAK